MSALRELLAVFDFEVDDKKLEGAANKIKDVKDLVKEVGGAVASYFAFDSVKSFIEGQIEAGSAINDMADRLGVGTDELQAFNFAAKLAGVETEAAAKSLGILNKTLGGAVLDGGEAAQSFATLGIKIKDSEGAARPLLDVTADLADAIASQKSEAEQAALATKFFGKQGAALIPILRDGHEGVEKNLAAFQALGGGLEKDFIDAADKAGDSIDTLRMVLGSLKSRVALEILPGLTSFVEKATKVSVKVLALAKHTNILKVLVSSLGLVAGGMAVKNFAKLAQTFGLVSKSSGGMLGGIKSLLSLGLQGALIAGGILLVIAVVEDLYTLFTGGKSKIGEWLDTFGGAGTAAAFVKMVTDELNAAGESIKALGPEFDALWSMVSPLFGAMGELIQGQFIMRMREAVMIVRTLVALFEEAFQRSTQAASGILGGASKIADALGAKGLAQKAQNASDAAHNMGAKAPAADWSAIKQGWVDTAAANAVTQKSSLAKAGMALDQGFVQPPPQLTGQAPAAGGAAPGTTNQTLAQQNQTTINFYGAQDAKESGKLVTKAVKDAHGSALQDAKAALASSK